jgi:hypothetical protein
MKTNVRVTNPSLTAAGLSGCAATGAPPPSVPESPGARADAACDASALAWTIGQVADDVLVERARVQGGAKTVRVIRPGVMITNEFNASRLNLRVDVERKVIAYNCG